MSFLNAMLLFGAGLAVIPVILHLLMRNKPKKLRFPALRLLQLRKRSNTKRMRLRHLWLLLLRILIIVLVALALARPTLPAANYAMTFGEQLKLSLLLGAGVLAYLGLNRFWNRKSVPGHVQRYRTVMLRGGVGVTTVLLILLLVLWPYGSRISAEWKEPPSNVRENFPVSAVLLFDLSPSMSYRQDNQTRLDAAKKLSLELVSRLPSGSQVAVGDNTSDAPIVFQGDATSFQSRLDQLEPADRTSSLDQRVRSAIQLQNRDRERALEQQGAGASAEGLDAFLREIYIFTDLARHAWQLSSSRMLREELERHPWLSVYLVDVSETAPRNTALQTPQLSGDSISRGSPLAVRVQLNVTGMQSDQQLVEIAVRGPDGKMVKQGSKAVDTTDAAQAFAEFTLAAGEPGLIEGEVRINSADPLAFDDKRYFTVEVIPPPRVLIVSDDRERGLQWATFLEPDSLKQEGRAKFACEVNPPAVLERINLGEFDVVCLLSVQEPSNEAWSRLEEFVRAGKGLFVSLGTKQINATYYESVAARNLLPGELSAYLRFTPPEYLDVTGRSHPLLGQFEELGSFGQLLAAGISYYWKVIPADDAIVIAPYTNEAQSPALLERSLGRGRALMLTTSIVPGEWNDLAFERFEFMLLSHFIVQRLNQTQNRTLNLKLGGLLTLPVTTDVYGTEYLLRTPSLQQLPIEADAKENRITYSNLDRPGHYGLRNREGTFVTGVSVNIPLEESDLTPLTTDEMTDLFGEGRFGIARSLEELEPVVRDRRLGQEIVPFLLVLLLLVFSAEQLTANFFYGQEETEATAAASASIPSAASVPPLTSATR